MADLRLRIVMDLAERVLSPLRNITKGSSDAAKSLRDTRDKLKELNDQQKAVTELRSLRGGMAGTGAELSAARAKVKALADQASQAGLTEDAMAKLQKQMTAADKAVDALRGKFDAQSTQAQKLREQLSRAGLSAGDLHTSQSKLRAQMEATTATIDAQKAALAKHGALKAQHSKAMASAAMTGAAGAGMVAAGAGVHTQVQKVMDPFAVQEEAGTGLQAAMMRSDGSVSEEFKRINDLAMQLGDKLPGTTADFQNMMTMLVRQGMESKTILGGMGEAAAYLGVQLKMPVTAAAEFAAKMQDATQTTEGDMMGLMDVIQKTYYLGVDSGNMLQGITKMSAALPLLGKRGLEASQMLAPLLVMTDQTGMAGEAAGNAVRKIIQGSLNEKHLKKANKELSTSGTGITLDFATKEGKFAGLDNLFEQLKKLKTITSDVKRVAVLKDMFGDDAETHQVLAVMMDKGVEGYRETITKMDAQAGLQQRVNVQLGTLTNTMEAAQGNLTNLLATVGETYSEELKAKVKSMGTLASATGEWVKENKQLVGVLLQVTAVLAVVLGVAGALGIVLAAVRAPLSLMSFGWGLLALKAPGLVAAVGSVGVAIKAMGWALLTSPVFWALALLATAAYMVWRNWDGIKGGLVAVWATVSEGVLDYWERIRAGASALWAGIQSLWAGGLSYLSGMAGAFLVFGGDMVDGLVNGITSRAAVLRDTVIGLAADVAGWFAQKLGIQSPSRVFMEAGGFIADGAAIGINEGQDRVRQAIVALTAGAALAMPMAPAMAVPTLTAPEVAAAQRASQAVPMAPQLPVTPKLAVPAMSLPTLNAPEVTAAQRASQAVPLAPTLAPALAHTLAQTIAPTMPPNLAVDRPLAAPLALDTRAPLSAAAVRGGDTGGGRDGAMGAPVAPNTINITVNAAPGMDPQAMAQAVARAVATELDRRAHAGRARSLSRLSDID